MQLFVDMDGVLADFDTGYRQQVSREYGGKQADDVDWAAVKNTKNFYLLLPPMPGMFWMWQQIEHMKPIILTGIPDDVPEALNNKRAWVHKHLGGVEMIGCRSRDKSKFGKPGDVLIDDWEKYRHLWIGMGGHWITHVTAAQSVMLLREHVLNRQMAVKTL